MMNINRNSNMKKTMYIVLSLLLLTMGSCKKYLDQVPDDTLTIQDIFKSKANTEKFLANVYNTLPNELSQRFTGNGNSGPWTASSDEGKYNWDFNFSNNMNRSTWNNTDGNVSYFWNNYYIAIRNATYFIKNIDGANSAEIPNGIKATYKAEAKALRALYYFFLIRTYGAVPIIGEDYLDLNAPISDLTLKRTPFDQCVDFIVSELDDAYNGLPYVPDGEQYGRITKGICKAYKVQALMLKASPLFNGNPDFAGVANRDGTKLYSQSNSLDKWTAAATAAKAFIDEFVPTYYDLYREADNDPFKAAYLSTRNVVTKDWNKEWIFARSISGSLNTYDKRPRHSNAAQQSQKGGGALGATQKIVDAYFTKNGLSIDTDPTYLTSGFVNFQAPFDVAARNTFGPWANREPRFYVGITYHNSYWLYQVSGSTLLSEFTFNGNSGRQGSTSDVTPTGYVVRKNLTNNDNARGALMLRLAEIYLNYAEALFESGSNSSDIVTYLNLIRKRAGIPEYGAGANQVPVPTNIRAAIRKERQVELAFENVRYFDTRRWKIAETEDAGPFYGLDLSKNTNDNAFYNKTLLETRIFNKRDYLYPIPNSEIRKNENLVQNPGW